MYRIRLNALGSYSISVSGRCLTLEHGKIHDLSKYGINSIFDNAQLEALHSTGTIELLDDMYFKECETTNEEYVEEPSYSELLHFNDNGPYDIGDNVSLDYNAEGKLIVITKNLKVECELEADFDMPVDVVKCD